MRAGIARPLLQESVTGNVFAPILRPKIQNRSIAPERVPTIPASSGPTKKRLDAEHGASIGHVGNQAVQLGLENRTVLA